MAAAPPQENAAPHSPAEEPAPAVAPASSFWEGPPPAPPAWDEPPATSVAPPATREPARAPVVLEERVPPTDDGERTLAWWQAQWDDFKSFVTQQGEDGQRAALRLKFCEPHAVEGATLTLGFPYSIHKEKIESPTERQVVEQAIQRFTGQRIAIHCVLAPTGQPRQNAKSKYEEAAQDPVVREALRHGARIVEVFNTEQRGD